MTREIKFRQFFEGKFHYWGYVKEGEFIAPLSTSEAQKVESQQFTGLKDKNGNEIYDGDVLKLFIPSLMTDEETDMSFSSPSVEIATVQWDEDGSRWKFTFSTGWEGFRTSSTKEKAKKVEVIGNIYENPELLKLPTP